MDLKEISETVYKFQNERDWNSTDPNHFISSILIELGELVEHYQWTNSFKELTDEEKRVLAYEFVDVLFYLFSLSHRSGIKDIEPYFKEKLVKLAVKFPLGITPEETVKRKAEYRKTGKNKLYD